MGCGRIADQDLRAGWDVNSRLIGGGIFNLAESAIWVENVNDWVSLFFVRGVICRFGTWKSGRDVLGEIIKVLVE
jgi:hypothetical protein